MAVFCRGFFAWSVQYFLALSPGSALLPLTILSVTRIRFFGYAGKTRRMGIDISGRYQINNWLFADINANFARPRSINEPKGQDYIPLAPTLTNTGGISFRLPNGLNGGLRYRYIKDRPANEDNSVVAKGYMVTDLSLNYTRKKYELGLAIENLLDVEWNETQFDTESRLRHEPDPVSEIHFTPGVPFFARLKLAVFF